MESADPAPTKVKTTDALIATEGTSAWWLIFLIVFLLLLIVAAVLLFFLLPKPRDVRIRGPWSANAVYSEGDIVTFEGNTYISAINGNTTVPSPTSGPWVILSSDGIKPSRFVLWLDQTSTAPGTPDGSIARPYKTMQDAINKVVADPAHPTLSGYTIVILGGDYTSEAPVFSPTMEKNLVFSAYGEIRMATFTWNVPTVGGTLGFHALTQVERPVATQGSIFFETAPTGNIFINNTSISRPTLSLIGVQGDPLLDGTNTGAGAGFVLTAESSRIGPVGTVTPTVGSLGFDLAHSYNTRFMSMNMYRYGLIEMSFFTGTTTIGSATSAGGNVQGIYNTFFQGPGTIDGPAGCIRCDEVTNFFLNQQAITAAGGATVTMQEQQFNPPVAPQTWP
jgi:hypothetical protein